MTAAPDHLSGEQALELALSWAGKGFPVFPVGISWDAGKGSTVKRPLCPSPGYHLATTDPDKVRALFADAGSRPDEHLGVGLVPGPAGVVVFDLDIKAGSDGIAFADSIGLPSSTYNGSTASGGRHRWFRKRAVEKVSNRVPEAWSSKIDVRSDNGYIVAPGTVTPWGSWEAKGNLDELALVPEPIWSQLDTGSSAGASSWRSFRPEHEARLHPSTLATHQLLVERFGVNPALSTFNEQEGREPWLQVCRPGKTSGISASIGRVGAGALLVFTSNWAPFVADKVYSLDDIEALADRLEEGIDADQLAYHNKLGEKIEQLSIEQDARRVLRARELSKRAADITPITIDELDGYLATAHAVWGTGEDILWASGEALMIAGKSGTGKSTIGLQVIRAMRGGDPIPGVTLAGLEPLGLPTVRSGPVLYLAADRPRQLARMAQKLLAGVDGVVIWPGPVPAAATGDPVEFLDWCRGVCPGVAVIVFDSLKDFVPRLNSDEDASAYNRTRQTLLANNIEVLELHHLRKSSGGEGSDAVFGSTLLVAGAGSILVIDGEGGDDEHTLHHKKQPANMVGPLVIAHDRRDWITTVSGHATVEGVLRDAGATGATRKAICMAIYGTDKGSSLKRVERRVQKLLDDGVVEEFTGTSGGGRPPKLVRFKDFATPYIDHSGRNVVDEFPTADVEKNPARNDPDSTTLRHPVAKSVDNPSRQPDVASLEGLTLDEAIARDPDAEDYLATGQYEIDPDTGKLRRTR